MMFELYRASMRYSQRGQNSSPRKRLQTLIWVPNPPRKNNLDGFESPILSHSPRFIEFPNMTKVEHLPQPGRQSMASSWYTKNSAISSCSVYSFFDASFSLRGTLVVNLGYNHVDLGFRIHCTGSDFLMRTAAGSLLWTFHADADEYERLSV